MRRLLFRVALLSAALCVPSAYAETAPCELHVWPGSGLNSVYSGWGHGGIVNGAVTGREGYPQVPSDPIATPIQAKLLTDAKPAELLQRAGDTVVIHDTALTSREIRSATGRLSNSTAPCYAEMIVDDIFFRQDWVNGSYLQTSFRFRDFVTDPTPRRVFGTWVKTKIMLLPLKKPDDLPAATAEMQEAFSANIRLFAQALLKPAKKK